MAENKEVIIKIDIEGNATVKVDDIKEGIKDTKKEAKSTIETFGIMDTRIGKIASGVVDFGKKGVKSLKTLKGALAAIGIGLLVSAVVSLVSYFTKTERGAQKLRVAMAAVGQVVSTVVDTFIKIGETLGKIGKIIGKVVTGNVTLKEGWKEAGEVGKAAIDDVANSYAGLNDRIKESISLQERENNLKVDNRKFLVEEAKLQEELRQIRLKTGDQLLSNEERIKSFNKAIAVNNKIFDERIRLAQEEYDIIKAKNAQNESSEADMDKEAELQRTLILLQADRNAQLKEFQDQRSGLIKQQQTQLEAAAQKEKERMESLYQAEVEHLQKREDLNNDHTQRKIDEAQAAFEAEMEKMDEEADAKIEKFIEHFEAMEEIKAELADLSAETDEERRILELQKIEDARKYDLDNFAKTEKDKAIINERYNKERDAVDQKYFDLEQQRMRNKMSMVADAAGTLSALAEEGSEEAKALAIVEATINTYLSATQAYVAAGNPILGAIMAAVAVAAGIANIAKIQSAALGGYVGGPIIGPSHQNGGVTMNMEGGEYIVNKRAMQNPELAATVIAANNAGNGNGNGPKMLTETDVVRIATTVVKSIPVQVVENDISETQRKVEVRESRFTR